MTNELLHYFPVFAGGLLLGIVFFGGLWLTVRRLPHTTHPATVFLSSALIRIAVVVTGVWLLTKGNALSVGVCLLGFLTIRILTVYVIPNDQNKFSKSVS